MSMYRQDFQVLSCDVDSARRLRLSTLFTKLQEAAIAHTIELGVTRERTLDQGLLWAVTQYHALFHRIPEYDEKVTLLSWPGKTMHLLFPRYYSLETGDGEPLVKASALWCLVDSQSRKVVFPERYGVEIQGVVTGEEIALPGPPKRLTCTEERLFRVPYSYVDLNGHMNNTRYFDLAEDCIPAAARGQRLCGIRTEYVSEARFDREYRIRWGGEGNTWFITGEGEHGVFRMGLEYEEA